MGRKEKTFERKLRPVALVAAERPKNSLHLLSDENDHDNGYGGGGRGRWALTGAAGDASGGVGGGRSNSRERGKGNKRRGGAGVEEEERERCPNQKSAGPKNRHSVSPVQQASRPGQVSLRLHASLQLRVSRRLRASQPRPGRPPGIPPSARE